MDEPEMFGELKNVWRVEKMFYELKKCLLSYKNVWWVTKMFGELQKCLVSWKNVSWVEIFLVSWKKMESQPA